MLDMLSKSQWIPGYTATEDEKVWGVNIEGYI